MATIEVIDLTDSPPSPPRSNNFSSSNNNSPVILHFGAVSAQYPNLHQTNYTLLPASSSGVHSSSMLGDRVTTTVLEPVPESSAFLFPHGTRLRDPWNQREHELFLMGLIKFGKGRWSKIVRHFLQNKTPQQVQNYAASFFRHLPATFLYGFRRRKLTTTNKNNPMAMPMMVDHEPQRTLTLFPESGASSSTGSMMSSTTIASANNGGEEVDLELRLG